MDRFFIRRPRKKNRSNTHGDGSDDDEDPSKERTGLHELWPGRADAAAKIETKLDIIAVHGLNGDLYKTWTDGSRLWLQDFLPSEIPEARIFTYGYNSRLAFSGSTSTIDDYARHLLERLKARRRDFEESKRPIIFICHSLGGLVFKKAMIIAHERSDRFESLSRSTYGVVFMGTPHRGSDLAFWSKFFASFANTVMLGNLRTRLLKDLQPKSDTLGSISSAFVERGHGLKKIFSFYEQQKIGGVLIVEPQSAILQLPNEVAIPLDSDHRGMCRFSTANSERFRTVLDALLELVTDSLELSQTHNTTHHIAFVQCLIAVDPKAILRRIASPYEGTCSWFTDDIRYLDWRSGRASKVLWLWGAAGAGKTVMIKHLIQHFIEQHKQPSRSKEIQAFFFCDDKDWLRRGHGQIARSLLDQILAQEPELIRYIDDEDVQIYASSDARFELELPEYLAAILWRALRTIIHRSRNTTFWFVIDALDEVESQSRSILLENLSSSIADDFGHRAYLVFADRVGPSARQLRLPAAVCELGGDDAQRDIQQYLTTVCRKFSFEKGFSINYQQRIESTLLKVAKGNFLHATLAWANFHKGVSFWSPSKIDDRLRIVQNISQDTVSYYCSLLMKIPFDAVAISRRAFAWSIGARRPLTVKELQHAVALDTKQRAWYDLKREVASAFEQEFEENFAYLLRCDYDGVVRLAHQTVKEILTSKPGSFSSENEAILERFRLNEDSINLEITKGCLTLLNFTDFTQLRSLQRNVEDLDELLGVEVREPDDVNADQNEPDNSKETFDIETVREREEIKYKHAEQMVQDNLQSMGYYLCFYACCYWNMHFEKCRSDEIAVRVMSRFLMKKQAPVFYRIAALLRTIPSSRAYMLIGHSKNAPGPPITFSLQLGDYASVVAKLSELGEDESNMDLDRWSPFMHAIANKRLNVVQYLLSKATVSVNRSQHQSEGPIHVACHEGSSPEILDLLIGDPRIDINDKGIGVDGAAGEAPLTSLLRRPAFKSACLKIIPRTDLKVFAKNKLGQSYLDQCFIDGLDEDFVIALLSRPNFDILNLRGAPKGLKMRHGFVSKTYYTSYIHLASNWGWRKVESLILRADPRQFLQHADKGLSLLEIHAYYGVEWRLRELLNDLPADVYKRYDPSNSRLLHLCAVQDWQDLALLLVQKFGLSTWEADDHQRTLLFYAAEFYWESIGMLCQGKTWEWINHQARDGKTALIVAAENRNQVAVETLLDAGADVLIQDKRGRTALHAAAEHGHRFVLKLLMQKPHREYGRDVQKRSLLHYLAMWESENFLLRYIEKDRPIIDIFDDRRRTPLVYSVLHGNVSAGEVLLRRKADPHLKDASGSTTLHYALSEGLFDFTKLLLSYDAPMSELDGYKRSTLQLALRSGNVDLIEFVINLIIEQEQRRQQDPRATRAEFDLSYMVVHEDNFRQGVIHAAAFLENTITGLASADYDNPDEIEKIEIVEPCISALRSLGADINLQDRYQVTPLHIAIRRNNLAAVTALLSYPEILVNLVDNLGCTPLDWAFAHGQPRIITRLRESGARHSVNFRQKLNIPEPQTKVETVYDPNLWALTPKDWRYDHEETIRSRVDELSMR